MSQFLSQVSRNLVAGFADSWYRNVLFGLWVYYTSHEENV